MTSILTLLFAALLLVPLAFCHAEGIAGKRPNVIFFFTDDQATVTSPPTAIQSSKRHTSTNSVPGACVSRTSTSAPPALRRTVPFSLVATNSRTASHTPSLSERG